MNEATVSPPLTMEQVSKLFKVMPIHEAAIELRVSEEDLRFFCRQHGIDRYELTKFLLNIDYNISNN